MRPIKSVDLSTVILIYNIRGEIKRIMTSADLVLSDIAPNISGIEDVDQANLSRFLSQY